MSRSTKNDISERTLRFLELEHILPNSGTNDALISKIGAFLQAEYDRIPEKERVGKGVIYVSTSVARAIMQHWLSIDKGDMLDLSRRVLEFAQIASKFG